MCVIPFVNQSDVCSQQDMAHANSDTLSDIHTTFRSKQFLAWIHASFCMPVWVFDDVECSYTYVALKVAVSSNLSFRKWIGFFFVSRVFHLHFALHVQCAHKMEKLDTSKCVKISIKWWSTSHPDTHTHTYTAHCHAKIHMICNGIYVTTKRFAKRITYAMTSQPDPTYSSGLMILSPIKQKRDTIFLSRSKLIADYERNQARFVGRIAWNVTNQPINHSPRTK